MHGGLPVLSMEDKSSLHTELPSSSVSSVGIPSLLPNRTSGASPKATSNLRLTCKKGCLGLEMEEHITRGRWEFLLILHS